MNGVITLIVKGLLFTALFLGVIWGILFIFSYKENIFEIVLMIIALGFVVQIFFFLLYIILQL